MSNKVYCSYNDYSAVRVSGGKRYRMRYDWGMPDETRSYDLKLTFGRN
jgi:hypothetical protein